MVHIENTSYLYVIYSFSLNPKTKIKSEQDLLHQNQLTDQPTIGARSRS